MKRLLFVFILSALFFAACAEQNAPAIPTASSQPGRYRFLAEATRMCLPRN